MNTFKVHILSAHRTFYEGECESIIIPAVDGQYGVLAGHCNTVRAIVPGKLIFRAPGQEAQEVAVSAGIMKVEDNDVLILADSVLTRRDRRGPRRARGRRGKRGNAAKTRPSGISLRAGSACPRGKQAQDKKKLYARRHTEQIICFLHSG